MEFQVALELKLLAAAVVVGLVQLIWAAAAAQPQRGLAWNVGPRDEPRPLSGMAGRLQRAFSNYLETFPMFVAVVVAAYLAGQAGTTLSVWGSIAYVGGRALYVPLYAFGVPVLRSLVWVVSLIGLVAVLAAVLNA